MTKLQFDTQGLEGYLTDADLESEDGVWLKFPGGRRFRVLRAGGTNRKFVRAYQTAIRPHRRQMDRGKLDPDISDRIMRDLYAKHVVVDWDGIRDEEGDEVPYSAEVAVAFFEAVPELFTEIVVLATEAATFSQETVEEAKKQLGES